MIEPLSAAVLSFVVDTDCRTKSRRRRSHPTPYKRAVLRKPRETRFLIETCGQVIRASQNAAGWDVPWFCCTSRAPRPTRGFRARREKVVPKEGRSNRRGPGVLHASVRPTDVVLRLRSSKPSREMALMEGRGVTESSAAGSSQRSPLAGMPAHIHCRPRRVCSATRLPHSTAFPRLAVQLYRLLAWHAIHSHFYALKRQYNSI